MVGELEEAMRKLEELQLDQRRTTTTPSSAAQEQGLRSRYEKVRALNRTLIDSNARQTELWKRRLEQSAKENEIQRKAFEQKLNQVVTNADLRAATLQQQLAESILKQTELQAALAQLRAQPSPSPSVDAAALATEAETALKRLRESLLVLGPAREGAHSFLQGLAGAGIETSTLRAGQLLVGQWDLEYQGIRKLEGILVSLAARLRNSKGKV